MFDFSGGELAIIAIVALVAIGPKELPGVLRMVGQWVGKARKMAREFQDQFNEAIREADVAEMKKQFEEAADKASHIASTSVLGSSTQDFKDAFKLDSPAATAPNANHDRRLARSGVATGGGGGRSAMRAMARRASWASWASSRTRLTGDSSRAIQRWTTGSAAAQRL